MSSTASARFRVAFTGDFLDPATGAPRYRDFGMATLRSQPHIDSRIICDFTDELTAPQIGDAQGLVVLSPRVTRASVVGRSDLLAISRFGVGFDSVDVPACTENDVLVLIAVGAVDYSVAEATLTWMLALSHHVRIKDALVREGNWGGRGQHMGSELRYRTLGLIGLGRIARALVKMVEPFGLREVVAFDPYVDQRQAQEWGVTLVTLDDLLAQSDFVSIHCPLEASTRGLIGPAQLARMKPDAFLINTSRGGIVDEAALAQALERKTIAGAALDVFAEEPLTAPHPLGRFDNVLLAPHCIAWTNELFAEIGRTACQSLVDMSLGREPVGMVNPEVLQRAGFREKWERTRRARS